MPPRPQRATDEPNLVRAFAAEMSRLRRAAGDPPFAKMAAMSQGRLSITSMHAVTDGKHLPKWETVVVFLEVLDVEPRPWRARWEWADDWQAERRNGDLTDAADTPDQTHVADPVEATDPATPTTPDVVLPAMRNVWRFAGRHRTWWAVTVTAVLAGMAGALLTFAIIGSAQTPAPPAAIHAVEVQNEIAIGPSGLIEDPAGPAYLSNKKQPYCARNGCKLDGTDMSTGALLVAVCQATGALMTNYNVDSDTVQHNSDRVKSTLWYRIRLPDGRTGYLSEVYLAPQYRHGLGLPTCA